jgi:hypothetical protein
MKCTRNGNGAKLPPVLSSVFNRLNSLPQWQGAMSVFGSSLGALTVQQIRAGGLFDAVRQV